MLRDLAPDTRTVGYIYNPDGQTADVAAALVQFFTDETAKVGLAIKFYPVHSTDDPTGYHCASDAGDRLRYSRTAGCEMNWRDFLAQAGGGATAKALDVTAPQWVLYQATQIIS